VLEVTRGRYLAVVTKNSITTQKYWYGEHSSASANQMLKSAANIFLNRYCVLHTMMNFIWCLMQEYKKPLKQKPYFPFIYIGCTTWSSQY
jgi:hypothetical protein